MIFIIYITGSYDAYPDNQIVSFLQSQWYEIFFVIFIFLNMFVFSSIPGSLLFDSYISSRSKYILIDEIKMQHSLILTFVSLGESNYEINIQKIIDFFHFLYENRIRYIDAITELCLKLNDDGNCTIVIINLFSMFWSSFNLEESHRKNLTSSLHRFQIISPGSTSEVLLTRSFLLRNGWRRKPYHSSWLCSPLLG